MVSRLLSWLPELEKDHEEEAQSSSSGKKLKLTLLSREWSSTKGGMSTLNKELALQLAKRPDVEVSIYLPECSPEDKRAAASHNIHLIKAEKLHGFGRDLWLSSLPSDHAVDCVVGHGVQLGKQVQLIKRQRLCKWVQIVYTDPEELGMFKNGEDAVHKGGKELKLEVKLCELSDQVVAVGPKLAEAFSRHLRPYGKDQTVLNLTPGIFSEFADVKQASEERRSFYVLLLGNGDSEDLQLKGYDIAAKAVAELKDMPQPYKLQVGVQSGKMQQVADMLRKQGISPNQLVVRGFKGREQLADQFCEVDLAIMPSRSEGFGLPALEALSAGLPVLVSSNSGLGEALKDLPHGSNCVVDSNDPKVWAKAIRSVSEKKRNVRLMDIKSIYEEYAEAYSWKKQCELLVQRIMDIPLVCTLDMKIECETINGPTPAKGTKRKRNTETDSSGGNVGSESDSSTQDVLSHIAKKFDPSEPEQLNKFLTYIQDVRKVLFVKAEEGSLIITVACNSLEILDELWRDYCKGYVNEMAQKYLVTEDVLKTFGLTKLTLKTAIDEAKYRACRNHFKRAGTSWGESWGLPDALVTAAAAGVATGVAGVATAAAGVATRAAGVAFTGAAGVATTGAAGVATIAAPVIVPLTIGVAVGAASVAAVWTGTFAATRAFLRALGRRNSSSNNREPEDNQNQDEQ